MKKRSNGQDQRPPTGDVGLADGSIGGSLHPVVRALTTMQTKLVATLNGKYALNGSMSTAELAWRNKTSRLAVWSAMRSLEAQGRAGYFRSGGDQWAASMWFVRDELKRLNDQAHANNATIVPETPNRRSHQRLVRIRSCLGCYAHEEGIHRSGDYCKLGFEVHPIELVAGFYGRGKTLIGCRCAPSELCPKPKTFRTFYALWKVKDSNVALTNPAAKPKETL